MKQYFWRTSADYLLLLILFYKTAFRIYIWYGTGRYLITLLSSGSGPLSTTSCAKFYAVMSWRVSCIGEANCSKRTKLLRLLTTSYTFAVFLFYWSLFPNVSICFCWDKILSLEMDCFYSSQLLSCIILASETRDFRSPASLIFRLRVLSPGPGSCTCYVISAPRQTLCTYSCCDDRFEPIERLKWTATVHPERRQFWSLVLEWRRVNLRHRGRIIEVDFSLTEGIWVLLVAVDLYHYLFYLL